MDLGRSLGNDAQEPQRLRTSSELMSLAGWNQYGVAGFYSLLTIFIAYFAMPLQNVDLVLPVVLMIRSEAFGFYCEMAHQKIGSPITFIDKPLYSCPLRIFFSYRRLLHNANVHSMQVGSLRDYYKLGR